MGEKRSNHTVYNVNYHFVWCPKYRHAILEPIEDSLEASFRDVCDERAGIRHSPTRGGLARRR
jgi:putative transposase